MFDGQARLAVPSKRWGGARLLSKAVLSQVLARFLEAILATGPRFANECRKMNNDA